MPLETDPARELVDLCTKLYSGVGTRGDTFLAEVFGVPAWSKEFYQIVFSIIERADYLVAIVNELPLDDDFKREAAAHVDAIKQAFGPSGLMNAWNQFGTRALAAENVQPIKMLAAMVRQKVSYPKLSTEEVTELLAEVDELLDWLMGHQTKEQDFIRQAILEGLHQFRFRLERVGWVGWGYTLDSLREVIGAYMALERGLPTKGADPVAEAILLKVGVLVKDFYEKTKFFKEAVETGDFMLRAYGAVSLLRQGSGISGLLTSGC